MAEEHVSASQAAEGGSEATNDDASARIARLEEQLLKLQEGTERRDKALGKMQSERDRAQKRLEREQKRTERLEVQQRKQVDKLPATEQTDYLRRYAAAADQKATRFELAHQYELDPTELDGEYNSPEAMRLRAIELSQAKGSQDLQSRLDKLTSVVEQIVEIQTKEAEQTPQVVEPDTGGPRGRKLPARDVLDEFTALAEEYRKKRDFRLATQSVLAKIHRDPSKVMGSAQPSEDLPPELVEKMKRR